MRITHEIAAESTRNDGCRNFDLDILLDSITAMPIFVHEKSCVAATTMS
jgi:hypothetical protein